MSFQWFSVTVFLGMLWIGKTTGFAFRGRHNERIAVSAISSRSCVDDSFVPPDVEKDYDIGDPFCIEAASRMRRINVPVSKSISSSGTVGISYIHWPASISNSNSPINNSGGSLLPLLLVHGFDSSCLEYRRLGPALAALGIETYAVDLLGWGFTQLLADNDEDNGSPAGDGGVMLDDFSATAKVEALRSFWRTLTGDAPLCIGGASLGGAAVIDFASSFSSSDDTASTTPSTATATTCPARAVVLLDAQGFTDGIGPPSLLPPFLARLGVKVLKSVPLRNSANQMSYYDKETFATEDALKTGRVHCLYNSKDDAWENSQMDFIKSGGFYPSKKIKGITQKTLVIWGREDGILDGNTYANQFMDELPNAQLKWIEQCGHVPHVEKSEETAAIIQQFLKSDELCVNE